MATSPENTDGLPTHSERPRDRDKSGIVILAVVIIFVISAAILAMGAVPEIFRQGDEIEAQKHEDDARAAQVKEILSHVDLEIEKLESNLTQLMQESEKRSNVSKAQRDLFDKKLDNATDQNARILANLDNKSKDHAKQSIDIRMLADNISQSLKGYGENSIEKFNLLLANQEQIYQLLNESDTDMDGNITIIDDGED